MIRQASPTTASPHAPTAVRLGTRFECACVLAHSLGTGSDSRVPFVAALNAMSCTTSIHAVFTKRLARQKKAHLMIECRQGKPQIYTRSCIYDGGVLDLVALRVDILPPLTIGGALSQQKDVAEAPYNYGKDQKASFLRDPFVPDMGEVTFMKTSAKFEFCVVSPQNLRLMERRLSITRNQPMRDAGQ
ncbi:hypothetical protein MCOR03_010019 [Pyricularia oryzae]|nr:hypothetical protein MCOR23_010919 [Pyricularia oryzae]KAI6549490.1 hypothetical protein MCOR03_010019 [Pyricularia oryzae]KAI6556810.1 hypothetical protein MCOR09_009582 [Pyricularia oryzae]